MAVDGVPGSPDPTRPPSFTLADFEGDALSGSHPSHAQSWASGSTRESQKPSVAGSVRPGK